MVNRACRGHELAIGVDVDGWDRVELPGDGRRNLHEAAEIREIK